MIKKFRQLKNCCFTYVLSENGFSSQDICSSLLICMHAYIHDCVYVFVCVRVYFIEEIAIK